MQSSMRVPTKVQFSRLICALAFVGVGIMHFWRSEIFVKIMPDYLPFPLELVYISGVFEILGGLGILLKRLRRIAIFGLILLLLAVFPANINMAIHPERFVSIPAWVLYLRIPLQFLIAFWVWSCRDSAET